MPNPTTNDSTADYILQRNGYYIANPVGMDLDEDKHNSQDDGSDSRNTVEYVEESLDEKDVEFEVENTDFGLFGQSNMSTRVSNEDSSGILI